MSRTGKPRNLSDLAELAGVTKRPRHWHSTTLRSCQMN